MLSVAVDLDRDVEIAFLRGHVAVCTALPMPRLNGRVITRAPARTASPAVPSPEPSSMTTISTGASARMSAITWPIASRS